MSSGISQLNSSSNAITNSTVSKLSAPRSSINEAVSVTFSTSTPKCSITIFLTKEILRFMIKNRFGRIINISSVVGSSGNLGQANYAASKAGLEGMTKSIALEVASRGITANCIAPGFIKTAMTSDILEKNEDKIINNIPIKRIGVPDDISSLTKFLASDKASYITGQTFHVNGGMLM